MLLFDEIEKAHADVFNVLLQMLDDGRLTDGQGRTVDFRNTVDHHDANIGGARAGHARVVTQALARALKPEFLNRVDDIIVFQPLAESRSSRSSSCSSRGCEKLLAEQKIKLELTPTPSGSSPRRLRSRVSARGR